MGWIIWGLKSWQGQEVFLFSKTSTLAEAHPASYLVGTSILSWGESGMKLTAQLHLVLMLCISEAIPLLPLCALMAWGGTTLPLWQIIKI
jgi:hypothetical protein